MSVFEIKNKPVIATEKVDLTTQEEDKKAVSIQEDKKWIIDQLKEKNKIRIQEYDKKEKLQSMLQKK